MKLPAPFKWLLVNYVQEKIKAFHKSSIQLKLYLILHLSIILMQGKEIIDAARLNSNKQFMVLLKTLFNKIDMVSHCVLCAT